MLCHALLISIDKMLKECHHQNMSDSDFKVQKRKQDIEKLQALYARDPQSQLFANLAELLREDGQIAAAELIARDGVKRHQKFATGLVVYGRILRDLKRSDEAEIYLTRACEIAPENILAQQTLGEFYLAQKKPKLALKSYKMLLMLNPTSQFARRAVSKLESLTADEYEDELFSMTKLEPSRDWRQEPGRAVDVISTPEGAALSAVHSISTKPDLVRAPTPVTESSRDHAFERMLSLIDAFIVRNDLHRALTLLQDSLKEFGDSEELQKRFLLVSGRPQKGDIPTEIKPLRPRQEVIREKKQRLLQEIMRRVDAYRDSHISL